MILHVDDSMGTTPPLTLYLSRGVASCMTDHIYDRWKVGLIYLFILF